MKRMITDNKGVSYYQIGNRYFKNTGWLEKEITRQEFNEATKNYLLIIGLKGI